MRVGILSYPMLFQREGGLQVQVRETIAALNRLGQDAAHPLQAELVDPNRERLDSYDLIHVFSAINGNYRVVEAATEMGVPVVLSPLLSPGWDRAAGFRARVADRLAGRLTAWHVQTSYAQTKRALQLARLVIALGEPERDAIMSGFLIEASKIRVFPNGISRQFFTARPEAFRHRTGITGPFVLMAGTISPYKNQLGLVQALEGLELPIVLIGRCAREDQGYLDAVLRSPWVRWLGELPHQDPLLAGAFAAAAVVALPSHGEVFPLAVLEALASGTPVVMTDENALDLPESAFALRKVAWHDAVSQRTAIQHFLAEPPDRAAVRALVDQYTWQRVASQIANCYLDLAARLAAERPAQPLPARVHPTAPPQPAAAVQPVPTLEEGSDRGVA
ncbi:glycosyltransferase [Pseudoduganella chitinolytica]|uniref:Glycosyltransferase n=1 Tax=Pseudoduganella chitinolytica TaxID=34070 RepID=A0ABY8BF24_9BURK|nr:glycosyltransferase [Pseudoduganella chitinolytica]WEF34515.1 glycosyltransferase [Pseudoduganella chitinolytica]